MIRIECKLKQSGCMCLNDNKHIPHPTTKVDDKKDGMGVVQLKRVWGSFRVGFVVVWGLIYTAQSGEGGFVGGLYTYPF